MGVKPGATWRAWTPAEIERLRELAGKVPIEEIARDIGRTESAVKTQAWTKMISLQIMRE